MRSKILKRYIICINEIQIHVTDKAEHYLQIDNQNWLIKLWPLILIKIILIISIYVFRDVCELL